MKVCDLKNVCNKLIFPEFWLMYAINSDRVIHIIPSDLCSLQPTTFENYKLNKLIIRTILPRKFSLLLRRIEQLLLGKK